MDYFDRQWPSDAVLQRQITTEQIYRNGESTLGLFVNDFEPDSDSVLGDFVFPAYTGYAGQDLTGEWTSPRKEAMGVWTTFAGQHTFAVTVPGEFEFVYGWLVYRGSILLDSGRFVSLLQLSDSTLPITIRPLYRQCASLAILAVECGL